MHSGRFTYNSVVMGTQVSEEGRHCCCHRVSIRRSSTKNLRLNKLK